MKKFVYAILVFVIGVGFVFGVSAQSSVTETDVQILDRLGKEKSTDTAGSLVRQVDENKAGVFAGVSEACWNAGICTFCDGMIVFVRIANVILMFLAVVGAIVFVYGAGHLVLSGGNENLISKGKETIKATIIGTIVVLLSWQLMTLVVFLVAKQEGPLFGGTKEPSAAESFNPITTWYNLPEYCKKNVNQIP